MRMVRLSDIYAHAFGHTSTTRVGQFVLGVVLVMLQGKTNRDGQPNCGVVVRNMDVGICPVGSLAFYHFELWMMECVCDMCDMCTATCATNEEVLNLFFSIVVRWC